jgi:predicted deacylase
MAERPVRQDPNVWGTVRVEPGQRREVGIGVSESYAGASEEITVYVWRGRKPGPTVFVTAAVHGDEINGTGVIRRLIIGEPFELRAGTLILVPVVNILGFVRHSRYLPDRRDLNRSFPGSATGSMASRMARAVFDEIIARSDWGIDLHTAAIRRTNFPNVRADMTEPDLAEFARAFGSELIVSGRGPKGSLRRSACAAGCPTLILEAGEVWKVEPAVVEYAVRGIRNCLAHLGMVEGEPEQPAYRVETDSSKWIRARYGGFLQFHIGPGDIVEEGDPIATNASLTGREQNVIYAPRSGIVLGMTTLPSVAPGDPICNLAFPKKGVLRKVERAVERLDNDSLHERMREDLARNIIVRDPPESQN